MGVRTYILKRIIYMVILLLFVITVNFMIFVLMPGNPIEFLVGGHRLKPEQIERLYKLYGLDQPLWGQYVTYVRNMLTWDFGYSFYSTKPISEEMLYFLPNTLLLMGSTTVLSMIIGIILGVLAAHKRGGIFDSVAVVGSLITYSLPSFWMGMIFLIIFSYNLHWFPAGHTIPAQWVISPPTNPLVIITTRLWYLFLPLLTLVLFLYGGYLLLTRAVMLETLTEDYVITARAKGLKERTVLFKHALKNASLPLITQGALSFGFMISGAIITEQVFVYPGLGKWIWDAITFYDYPVLQAIFYIIALCVIIANFAADLLYGVIDPRVKYG